MKAERRRGLQKWAGFREGWGIVFGLAGGGGGA